MSNQLWLLIFLIAICANCYIIAYEIVCWRVCTIMQKQDVGIEESASKRVSYEVFLFP